MDADLEMGLDTFGDVSVDDDGHPVAQAQVIRDIIEEGALADQAGVQHFGIGEHHRDDFAVSAPDIVLELLFEEKLALLARLRTEAPVTWSGTTRSGLTGQRVYPTTESGQLPIWVGVGGCQESVVRAARHGLPMMLAIIGGNPARFSPYIDLYRGATDQFGLGPLPVGVHSGGFIAETDEEARDILYPYYQVGRDRIGGERGWPPVTRQQYEHDIDHGSLYVGSPATVAEKIAGTVASLGVQRFDLKYANGAMPHRLLMRSIELYGSEVMPRVREILQQSSALTA